jgi:hypothetical protein
MPKLNTKENRRIIYNFFGLRIMDAIPVVSISAQKHQWLVQRHLAATNRKAQLHQCYSGKGENEKLENYVRE